MPWTIVRQHPHVAVVTMNSNKVNAQNPAFFADLHAAFDRLEGEFNDCAVVLTGSGVVFTAGLDFDHHFPLFARRSLKEIDAGFDACRATNLRLFTYPRPTVAAINGHAYAGGLITALDCDHLIAAEGPLQFSLNEVPIGIPMPAVYCEIIKHAVGPRSAFELTQQSTMRLALIEIGCAVITVERRPDAGILASYQPTSTENLIRRAVAK
jgi:enoyl-CoA hydratase